MSERAQTSDAAPGLVPVIGLVSMIGPFSIDTYLPSFPHIAAALGVALPELAQTLGFYLFAFAVATLLWGPLSDAFGRRRVLLVSLLGFIVASVGCALAGSLGELLLWRTVQGVAACGGMVIGRAVVRDVYHGPQAQRAMAHVMLVFAMAPAIAPVIGGWLEQQFDWHAVFWFLALFGVVSLLLVWRRLPESHPPEARQSIHPRAVGGAYLMALRHLTFLALVGALSAAFGGMFLYITGSPALIYDHLGLGEGDFGWFFIPAVSGMMSGSWLAGRTAHRWTPRYTVGTALLILSFAFGLNLVDAWLFTPTLFGVVAPLVLYAFGVALMMPNLSVLALDCFPHNRGMAAAVQGFAQMGFNALIAGLLMPWVAPSLLWMALAQGALLLIAWLFWTSVRPHLAEPVRPATQGS